MTRDELEQKWAKRYPEDLSRAGARRAGARHGTITFLNTEKLCSFCQGNLWIPQFDDPFLSRDIYYKKCTACRGTGRSVVDWP